MAENRTVLRERNNNEAIANRFRATSMKSVQNFAKKTCHMLKKKLYSSHALCTVDKMIMVEFQHVLEGASIVSSMGHATACGTQSHLCHHGNPKVTVLEPHAAVSLQLPHINILLRFLQNIFKQNF